MHELGIIVHVMRTVEEVAAENNLTEIRSVRLFSVRSGKSAALSRNT